MTTKTGRTVKAKLGVDGKLRRAGARGRIIRPGVVRERLDQPGAFEPDADAPVLTRRELREFAPVSSESTPDIAALRRRLHLSQGAFAMVFDIPLPTIKDWEQGRRKPDAPARAYLRVIAQNPRAVQRALNKAAV